MRRRFFFAVILAVTACREDALPIRPSPACDYRPHRQGCRWGEVTTKVTGSWEFGSYDHRHTITAIEQGDCVQLCPVGRAPQWSADLGGGWAMSALSNPKEAWELTASLGECDAACGAQHPSDFCKCACPGRLRDEGAWRARRCQESPELRNSLSPLVRESLPWWGPFADGIQDPRAACAAPRPTAPAPVRCGPNYHPGWECAASARAAEVYQWPKTGPIYSEEAWLWAAVCLPGQR